MFTCLEGSLKDFLLYSPFPLTFLPFPPSFSSSLLPPPLPFPPSLAPPSLPFPFTLALFPPHFFYSSNSIFLGPEGVISYAPLPPWFGPIGLPKCTTANQQNCTWVGPSGTFFLRFRAANFPRSSSRVSKICAFRVSFRFASLFTLRILGGMTAVYKAVRNDIDYFFAQFYNQGACYTTYLLLLIIYLFYYICLCLVWVDLQYIC